MRSWAKQEIRRKEKIRHQNKHRSRRSRYSRATYRIKRLFKQCMQYLIRDTVTSTELALRKTVDRMVAVNSLQNGVHLSKSHDSTQGHNSTEAKHSNRNMQEKQTTQILDSLPPTQKNTYATTSDINVFEEKKKSAIQDIIDLLARSIVNQRNESLDIAKTSNIHSSDIEKVITEHISSDIKKNLVADRTSNNAETDENKGGNKNEKLQNNYQTLTTKRKLVKEHGEAKLQKITISEKTCKTIENIKKQNKYINEDEETSISQSEKQLSEFSCNSSLNFLHKLGTCITPSVIKDAALDEKSKIDNLNECNKRLTSEGQEINSNKQTLYYCIKDYENELLREEQKKTYPNPSLISSNQLLESSEVTKKMEVDLETTVYDLKVIESCKSPSQQQNSTKFKEEQNIPKLHISHKYQQNVGVTHFSNVNLKENHVTHTYNTNRPLRTWYLPPEPTTSSFTEKEPITNTHNLPHEIDPSQAPIPVMIANSTYNNYNYNKITKQLPNLGVPMSRRPCFCYKCERTTPPIALYCSNIEQTNRNRNSRLQIQDQIPYDVLNSSKDRQLSSEKTMVILQNCILQHTNSHKPINLSTNSANNENKTDNAGKNHVKSPLQLGIQHYAQIQPYCSKRILPNHLPKSNIAHQTLSNTLIANSSASRNPEKVYTNAPSALEITTAAKNRINSSNNPFLPVSKPCPYIPTKRLSCRTSQQTTNENKIIKENFLKTLISLGLATIPSEEASSSISEVIFDSTTVLNESEEIIKNYTVADTTFKENCRKKSSPPKLAVDSQQRINFFNNSKCPNCRMLNNDQVKVTTTLGLESSKKLYNLTSSVKLSQPAAAVHMHSDLFSLAGVSQKISSTSSNVVHIDLNSTSCSSKNVTPVSTIDAHTKHQSSLNSKTFSGSDGNLNDNKVSNNIVKAETPSRPAVTSDQNNQLKKFLGQHLQKQPNASSSEILSGLTTTNMTFDHVNFSLVSNNNSRQNLIISDSESSASDVPFIPTNLLSSSTMQKHSELTSIPQKRQRLSSTGPQMPDVTSCSPSNISQKHLDASGGKLPSSSTTVPRKIITPNISRCCSKLSTEIAKTLKKPIPSKITPSNNHVSKSTILSGSLSQMRYNHLSTSKTVRNILRKKSLQEPLSREITTKLRIVNNSPLSGFGVKVNRLRPFKP